MLNETFYLDGDSAKECGVSLQEPIQFSAAKPCTSSSKVSGKNGDIVYYTGAFENRQATAKCFALHHEVAENITEINNFLFRKIGYRRLETTDDPACFWLARVCNSAKMAQRMRTLAPFDIKFDCKPQRFLKSGEEAILFSESGELENFTAFDALPLITVYGDGSGGAGTVSISGITVDILSIGDQITLDCDLQDAYRQVGDSPLENCNSMISATEFPKLVPGANTIHFSGSVVSVEIVPRWWTL